MRKLPIQVHIGLLVVTCLGVLFGVMFSHGVLQYWHKLSYFPYLVKELVFISGNNLGVEAVDGSFYKVDIDCYENKCWEKVNSLPSSSEEPVIANENSYYDFSITKECKFEHFTYSFFRRMKTCAITKYLWFEGNNWIYIILDEKGELWKWTGGINSLSSLGYIATPVMGGIVGLILSSMLSPMFVEVNKFIKSKLSKGN